MDTNAYRRLKTDFQKARLEKWGTIACSVGVALTTLGLLVLLYLFVDLLVWRGTVPTFAQLPPARQNEFAREWTERPESQRLEAARRATPDERRLRRVAAAEVSPAPTAEEWELRWRAGLYLALRERVGPVAADAFLPEQPDSPTEPPRLGILSLVARERNRWTGSVFGWLAGWNEWAWRPGPDGAANVRYLNGLLALALTLTVTRGLLLNGMAYLAAVVTLDLVQRVRRALYLHTYRLGSLAVRTGGPGEAVELFTRQAEAVGAAVRASLTCDYRCPILVVGLLAMILLAHFWLAVSFLLLAALVWLIGGQVAAHFQREARLGSRQAAASLNLLVESLGLMRLVKCYQMERFNLARVERQLAESARSGWRKLRGDALSLPLLGSVALIAGVALLYLGGRSVLAGEFTVSGLAVMAAALIGLRAPIADWFESRSQVRRGREAAEAIWEYLSRKGEAAEAADAEYLPPLTTRIEFRGVKLEEPGTGRKILENITFAIPAGAKIALVGPDPLEKRSLVYLLPRFFDPTAGEIRIEDKNIRWVTHESLRAQIGIVMQDDWILSDTVANNIGCGDPQYTLPQIIEAAKLAHAHQFIEKLPYGYETQVGPLGYALKPGERYRLALARALLRDPSILIIEEPTGPMDEDTLALVEDTFERALPGRTVIFLAHRLSTLRRVDRVFLLKNGHIEASGTHRDLWQNNEYYRKLQILADASLEVGAVSG